MCLALLSGLSVDNWSRGLKQTCEFGVAFLASAINTLAWKIPWTEEAGGLQSMGSRRVRHD